MFRALKSFGQGILWAVLLPFILVGVAIVAAFGAIDFVIEFVIMIVNFFKGKRLFPIYPEDQKAYDILKRAIDKQNGETNTPEPVPQTQTVYVQQNFYTGGQPPYNMPPSGAIPPGYPQGQIPPGYNPGYPQAQIPPAYPPQAQIPQQPNAAPLPPVEGAYTERPRPELAQLPTFDASVHPKTESIEIDINEGDEL